jgi:hypothetical protein
MNLQYIGIWCFVLAGITLIIVILEIILWNEFNKLNLIGRLKNIIRKKT